MNSNIAICLIASDRLLIGNADVLIGISWIVCPSLPRAFGERHSQTTSRWLIIRSNIHEPDSLQKGKSVICPGWSVRQRDDRTLATRARA